MRFAPTCFRITVGHRFSFTVASIVLCLSVCWSGEALSQSGPTRRLATSRDPDLLDSKNSSPTPKSEPLPAIKLTSPALIDATARDVAKPFLEKRRLEQRAAEAKRSLKQELDRKQAMLAETAKQIGKRPELADPTRNLQRDEFETVAEFNARVNALQTQAKTKLAQELRVWEQNEKKIRANQSDRLAQFDKSIAKLTKDLADIEKNIQQMSEATKSIEGKMIWLGQSPLTRYDIDRKIFPGLQLAAAGIASPANSVILHADQTEGATTALVATASAVNGTRSFDIEVPDRDIAKKFKEDWESGQVLVLSDCRCRGLSLQMNQTLVVRDRVTKDGPLESAPDYGKAAATLGIYALAEIFGAVSPDRRADVSNGLNSGISDAMNRKTRKTTVVQERESYVVNAIPIEIAVSPPSLYKVIEGRTVEPYKGVSVRER